MNIVIGTVLIWAVALWALRKVRREAPDAPLWPKAGATLAFILPRVTVGVIGAGFVAALLPAEFVQARLGAEAGLSGIALGALFGALTPAGPFVAFALAAAALKAGAGAGAAVAYVTAWAMVAIIRLMVFELPMMGAGFVRARLAVSAPVPILLGIAVAALAPLLGVP